MRAEHFYKQFQEANQRHVLLIEELEQNQHSIEQAYEQRFRLVSSAKFGAQIVILLYVYAVSLWGVVLLCSLSSCNGFF